MAANRTETTGKASQSGEEPQEEEKKILKKYKYSWQKLKKYGISKPREEKDKYRVNRRPIHTLRN